MMARFLRVRTLRFFQGPNRARRLRAYLNKRPADPGITVVLRATKKRGADSFSFALFVRYLVFLFFLPFVVRCSSVKAKTVFFLYARLLNKESVSELELK